MKKFLLLIITPFVLALAIPGNESFRFVIIGDRTGSPVDEIFDETIDEVNLLNPDFVINVGDLIHGYSEDTTVINAQWDTVLNIVKKLPCKFYFVPGNHDIQNETDRVIFQNRTGNNRYYSFDYENSHFIILDNTMTQWTLPQNMDEAQVNWLKFDLEKHKDAGNIFVFFHVPTYLNSFISNTPDPLVELFEKHGVRAVFNGHFHSYSYLLRSSTEYIVVGSSGGGLDNNDFVRGNFYQFLFVTVKGHEHNIAVIKEGNVFPPNVVTASEILLISNADTGAVKFTRCIVKEESKKVAQSSAMTINNFGPDSISQSLIWIFDTTRYSISLQEIPINIESEQKGEYKLNFTVANGSDIFPLPQFVLAYPFTYGKICTLRNSLAIKRLKRVKEINSPPIIDGDLSDAVWQKIKPITNLGSYDGLSVSSVEKTEIYLAHDGDNLYIGARCLESNLSQLTAGAIEHDGATYMDDNLWFFIDSDLDQETYYQLIVNSNGVAFDRLCSLKNGVSTKDITWNGHWDIKAGKEDSAWTIEMKIPKKGLEPFNDKQWGFNFRRLQTRLADGYWSIPFGHDPKNFGIIEFETPKAVGSGMTTEEQGLRKLKSEARAVEWSVLATLIPIGIGVYPGRWGQPYRGILAGVAGIFGPSAGHFYANQWVRGLKTAGLRTGLAGLGSLVVLAEAFGEDWTGAMILAVGAGGFILSSAVYDVATAPSSARKYNAQIEKTSRLQLLPYIDLQNEQYGLAAVYRF